MTSANEPSGEERHGCTQWRAVPITFDDLFPQGAYLMGDIQPLTEYQSQEDKTRNRPVRPRIDEQTGRRLYRATIADPSAEKERDKSIAVESRPTFSRCRLRPLATSRSGLSCWRG